MKKKYALKPAGAWETGALEAWLEREAAKGWRLTDCGRMLATFTAMEPGAYRVRLRPQPLETPEARRERGEACREMGWDCTAVITGGDDDFDCEVFYCGDPSAPELDTDPVAQKWAWEKSLKNAWRWGWIFLLLFAALAVFLLYHCISQETTVAWFLKMGPELVLVWLLYAVGIFGGVRKLLGVWRTRNLLDAGVAPPHTGNWRKSRCLMVLMTFLLLSFWTVHLAGLLGAVSADVSLDDPALPYVTAETLDPVLSPALRDYVYADREWAPLAPERYSVVEVFPEQKKVTTCYDRVLFSALAGPLYREKLAAFREKWPDAELTVLARDGFDQAALLKNGEVSILTACREKAVLTVWTNTGIDLAVHLDDYVQLLDPATSLT